jgi:SH3-like domain-containing protein
MHQTKTTIRYASRCYLSRRVTYCALLGGAAILSLLAVPVAHAQSKVGDQALTSGLNVPRFVSIKPSRVNLRSGPGTEYPTTWVYKREGLPLEIIKEFEAWRQVRDSEGSTGWVLQNLLSGRRTALIASWEVKPGVTPPQIALYADESETARRVATVEAGVIANVLSCNGRWCYVAIESYRGYIPQKKLWGVYESEVVK